MTNDIDVRAVAFKVVKHLDGFSVAAPKSTVDKVVVLEHEDGRALVLLPGSHYNSWSKPGQLHIYGRYPMNNGRQMYPRDYGMASPSMNVSATKAPERIAADIKRRLLSMYTDVYRECVARAGRDAVRRNEVRETTEMLASTLGIEPTVTDDGYSGSLRIYYGQGPLDDNKISMVEASIQGSTVKLTVSCSPDTACLLAQILVDLIEAGND